jgi:hypothetical protein
MAGEAGLAAMIGWMGSSAALAMKGIEAETMTVASIRILMLELQSVETGQVANRSGG